MKKENNKGANKNRLGVTAVWALVVFSILVMVATSISIVLQYRKDSIDRCKSQAISYAKVAAAYIDGDRVSTYIKTGKKDAYYDEVERFLNINQQNSALKYYYVYVPQENDLIYVWDADTTEGACQLGDHESYMKNGKEASMAAFNRKPKEKILISRDQTYGYIASAFYPVYNSDGSPVALVGVDFAMPGMTQLMQGFVLTIIFNILLVLIGFTAIFYVFVRKRIIRPIKVLSTATHELVEHLDKEEPFTVDIRTGDEIEDLAHSFERMDEEIRAYIQKVSTVMAEKERIGAELNVATQIQSNMLPSIFPPFPERKEFDIYATMDPAKEVGGDFYDFFLVDEDHLALVMADVSGKGVPAALFMVIAKTLIKNKAQTGASPKEVLETVNNQLCENNEADMFVTVWLGIYEISTGCMRAANAGHEFPVICRKDGTFELYKDPHGLVVAYVEDFRYQQYEFSLKPGDTLFLYTDGVPEATNAKNELYTTDRMIAALNQNQKISPKELLVQVRQDIDAFVQDAPQFDDITMLALRILQ